MRYKEIYICPYKDEGECPLENLEEFDRYGYIIFPDPCHKGPLTKIENGTSVCRVVVDLDDPCVDKGLSNLENLLKWRLDDYPYCPYGRTCDIPKDIGGK